MGSRASEVDLPQLSRKCGLTVEAMEGWMGAGQAPQGPTSLACWRLSGLEACVPSHPVPERKSEGQRGQTVWGGTGFPAKGTGSLAV